MNAERIAPFATAAMLHLAAGTALWFALVSPAAKHTAPAPQVWVDITPPKRVEPARPVVKQRESAQRAERAETPPQPVRATTPAPVVAPVVTQDASPVSTPAVQAPVAHTVTPNPPAAPPSPTLTPARFDAAYLNNPKPAYPMMSRRLGEQGRVLLRVRVSAAGLPEKIELHTSSGSERLDQTARDTVAQWRFTPAQRGVEAIAAWVTVPLVFKLEQ
jgi:protein TonB